MSFALNEAQHKALSNTSGPLLVLAGAGSGKTRVITEKISYLINHCKLTPQTIYAVTFTNKASNEMRHRLALAMGKVQADRVNVSTFHVLGMTIMRKELQHLSLKSNFTLFDEADSVSVLQSLSAKGKALTKPEAYGIKNQISRWKSANLLPVEAKSVVTTDEEEKALSYYDLYQEQLSAYSAVDFDDLIMHPTRLLRENAMVLERWCAKVAYLLVDEYQDTNHSQYELVGLLTKFNRRFTLVGDDDQSIYSWRGARPENINLLKADYPELEVIMLEENYRSTNTVLNAANHLISHNPHAYQKKLWSSRGDGDKINIVDADDDKDEALQVVNAILAHRFKHQQSYENYAILYRSNHQATIFEKTLRLNRIPYKITGGPSFFSRQEIKDIIAYCRLIINSHDDNAFLRIVNTPRRGIGAVLLKQVGEYAKVRQVSLFKVISEIGFLQQLPEKAAASLRQFHGLISGLTHNKSSLSPVALLQEVLAKTHYTHWLTQEAQTKEMAEQRIENLQSFIDWIGTLNERQSINGGKTDFAETIATLLLLEKDRQQASDKKEAAVQLMTMHAAKGLEFENVHIVGFEEGILPHEVSVSEGNIEEERRVAYVAMTRAKSQLMISYAHTRKQRGKLFRCKVSRFLSELDQSALAIKSAQQVSQQEVKENNQQQMARLKAMFSASS